MFNKFVIPIPIKIENTTLKKVEEYVYLGQMISSNGGLINEIKRRMKLEWVAMGKLRQIFRSRMTLCLKRKLFNEFVLPVMTYESETWTLNVK